jgi:hypothetical protein
VAENTIVYPGTGKFTVYISPTGATAPYAEEGSYSLSFIVFDDGERVAYPSPSATATAAEGDSLTLTGVAVSATAGKPFSGTVATVKNTPKNGTTGSPVSDFTALINWGDGSGNVPGTVSGSGNTLTVSGGHTYATAGTYGISVSVRDDPPGTASAGGIVSSAQVVDPPSSTGTPTAAFSAPTAAVAGSPTGFDGSGSSDSGGTITGYSWDFGDGSSAGTGVTPQHTYASAGTYTVKLTVTDNSGQTGTASHDLTVAPPGTTTAPPPAISGATISPAAIRPERGSGPEATASAKRAVKRGARVTFTLSHAATVTFTVQRKVTGRKVGRRCVNQTRANRTKKRCSRLVMVGRFTRPGVAGANGFHFTGRVNGRPLAPGNYVLSLVATDAAGMTSSPVSRPFRTIT